MYEKAYRKAAEVCHSLGLEEYEKTFLGLISGILGEKSKHQERAEARGEKIEQPEILRATKGYTDLLTKAYTEGSLSDIIAAILPCSKLYMFIGQEIKRSIPDHNHEYSEWINVYSDSSVQESTKILEDMLDAVLTEDKKESARFDYSEAMRLEFEFFNQQSHVYALPTTKIFKVASGCVCHSDVEVECSHVSDGKVDKATLRWSKIQEYLKTHDYIMNADVRELCGVSAATANRILAYFVTGNKLVKCRVDGHWGYQIL